jgi:alpha-L-fucosidase 2
MSEVNRRNFLRVAGGTAGAVMLPLTAARKALAAPTARLASNPTATSGPERGVVSTTWTEDWESGFVTGNGNLGAVIYGAPETPGIVVNNHALYTAELPPSQEDVIAQTASFLPQMRDMITQQGYTAMLDYSWQELQDNGLAPGETIVYNPGFFLNCTLQGADSATGYARSENFETGEVETTWQGSAGAFRTRLFASRADNVIVFSITGPGTGQLNATLTIPPPATTLIGSQSASGEDWIGLHNLYGPDDGGYDSVVLVSTDGGSATITDGTIAISDASEALLLMRIDRFRPPQAGGTAELAASLANLPAHYDTLLRSHVRIHSEIFNRTRLDLGGGADRALTTDVLIARAMQDRAMPAALMEKIYDACRYVIISSSGELPPNLQGIWNGNWSPAFNDDYSTDANLELAIDSMCSGNMPELLDGFFSLIEAGVPSWQQGARDLAGCRGILYPARMQDQGTYFQQSQEWQWFNQLSITGWFGHYFYDYFRYTGDREFLKNRAIPYLKQCALFYEDWFITDPDGKLRSTPDFSPECANADNATITIASAKEVLSNLVEGCELLGVETDNVPRWRALLAKFPDYMVNTAETTGGTPPPNWQMETGVTATADGTLKEFIDPNMLDFPDHRHLSFLYPLFVSYELDPDRTPDTWAAASKAYVRKIHTYTGTESHYRMQSSLCAARLGRGNDIWSFLSLMAANQVFHTSLVPSHYDYLNVFNVDASGGIPSVVNNGLIFSLPGQLDLLPALPGAWPAGSISGILARGQITVEKLSWNLPQGSVTAQLNSAHGQQVAIGLPPGLTEMQVKVNGRTQPVVHLTPSKLGCDTDLRQGANTIDLTFASTIPVRLLSQGCPATASTVNTQDGNMVAANAVDGDLTTRWGSDYADDQWLMVDLGAVHQITEVWLNWEAAAGKDYNIAVSEDGQSWTIITNVTGNSSSGWLDYPGLTASGRYVRVNCLTRLTSYGFSLWEFQVFGR